MELVSDVGHVESRSSHLETVLALVQDRCMVCTEHTIGIEIVLDALEWKLNSVHLVIVLLLMQHWSTVCSRLRIVLEAPDGTPR
jgi:hypothetical protein